MEMSQEKKLVSMTADSSMSLREDFNLHQKSRWVVRLVVFFFSLAGFSATASPVDGQGIDREYKLKAAFLYKFATYFQWPDSAFETAESPFVIGILGSSPVETGLRKIAAVKKVGNRKIVVQKYQSPDDVDACHILFMSRAVNNENQKSVIKRLARGNILFVGETLDFLKLGGVIDLVVQENHIRIYLSKSAYEREGLKTNAQFLRVATIVK